MSKISIVIINDDACEYLDKMFLSLTEGLDLNTFEIIFIDNCSSDESVAKAQSYGVTQLFSFKKKVSSRAELYNKGIELSSGEFIMYTHSDIYYDKDFFTKLIENDAINDATCGFINFAQYNSEGYFTDHEQLAIDNESRVVYHKELYQFVPQNSNIIYIISEACFMVRKEIVQKILFNPNYNKSYFDYEILDRILREGYKQVNLSECKFTHYFIELHEKLSTDKLDKEYFLLNNMHLIEIRKQFDDIIFLNRYIEDMRSKENDFNKELLDYKDIIDKLNIEVTELKQQNTIMLKDIKILKQENSVITDELERKSIILGDIYKSKAWKVLKIFIKT